MRLGPTRMIAPLTLLSLSVSACRNASRDQMAKESLQRDLELAQASAVSLAPRDLPATRFVSALEAGERATAGAGTANRPARHSPTKAPKAHAQRHAPPAPAAVAAAPSESRAAAEPTPAPAPASPTVTADAGPAPAPASTGGSGDGVISVSPTDGQGGSGGEGSGRQGHGPGIGGILGGIIGVVIRGGSIGDGDHCERDHPGRRGGYPYPAGGIGLPYPGSGGTIGIPIPRDVGGRVGRPRF